MKREVGGGGWMLVFEKAWLMRVEDGVLESGNRLL